MRIRRQNSGWSQSKIPKAMTLLSAPASKRASSSYSKVWTKSRTEPALMSRHRPSLPKTRLAGGAAAVRDLEAAGQAAAAGRGMADEHFSPLHRPSGGHFAADDGCTAGGSCRIQAAAGFSTTPGRLSHHSGRDLLSRSESGCHVVLGHGAARAPIRTGARIETDDVDQFLWVFRHHASICP